MQIGAYEVLGEIARGGAGVVYRARHMTHATPVAIKVLQLHSTPDFVERFRREAHVTFRLRHPHVVGLLEWGQHQAHPYLVLELIEGQSLEERLRQGPLPARQIFQLGRQIADALHYAHGLGLVHRDIKPANILLEARTGRAVLTDFGIAQVEGASGERLTVTGEVLGTPAFMSPEQARGTPGDMGPLSDVYSLGATLYAALCGRPPVTETSPIAAMAQVMTEAPPHPKDVYPAAHPELTELVLRCLEKTPNDRFPNAAALRDALTDASRTGTVGATGANRAVERRRSPVLIAVAAAALAAFGGWGLGRLQGTTSGAQVAHGEPFPTPDEGEPPPADGSLLSTWLTPYRHLVQLRQTAEKTGRWEDYARLARAYAGHDEPRRAAEELERAIEAATESDDRSHLIYLRGKMRLDLLEPELALADADQLLADDDQNPEGWRLRALALQDSGTPGALQAIDRAKALGGVKDYETALMRAHVLRAAQRVPEALAELEALEKAGLDLANLVKIRLVLSNDPEAVTGYLDELIRRNPSDPEYWRERALQARRTGDWDTLVKKASRAYALGVSDYTSATLLLTGLLHQSDWESAGTLAKELLNFAPPELGSRILAELAFAYANQKPLTKGNEIRQLAQAFRQDLSGARMMLHAQANLSEAEGDMATLVKTLEPLAVPESCVDLMQDADLLGKRVVAARSLRNLQQAHRDLSRIEKLNPHPSHISKRGALYLRQGLPAMTNYLVRGQLEAPQAGGVDYLHGLRAVALYAFGQYEPAIKAFGRGPKLTELRALFYARALRLAGREGEAIKALERVYPRVGGALPPGATAEAREQAIVDALKQRVREHLQTALTSEVVGILDELLILEPTDRELRLQLVLAKNYLPSSDDVQREAKRLLHDTLPQGPTIYSELAPLLEIRRPELAALLYQEVLAREPQNLQASRRASSLYLTLGLYPACERVASAGLEHASGDAQLLALRGLARTQGQLPGAEDDLRRVLGNAALGILDDNLSLALAKVVARKTRDPEQVLRLLERTRRSGQANVRASALIYVAWALLEQGDKPAAHAAMGALSNELNAGVELPISDKVVLTRVQAALYGN